MPETPTETNLLAGLNDRQAEAVRHTDGPLLILAGAGSGKTRVLTHRVAHLIGHHGVAPGAILAVTFTNKAATEMRERIVSLVGPRSRAIWVGTFHATCARILRESGVAIGIAKDFTVYDDGDQLSVVRAALKDLNIDDSRFAPRAVLAGISRAKEKMQGPQDLARSASGMQDRVVASVYQYYEKVLTSNGALDFDDLLTCAVRLLEESQDALARYRDRFRYILVDEYQDVNYAQYRLVHALAGAQGNLCVVGDDDQSIYAFRGADVDLMLRFAQDYPAAKIIHLEQNYRSTPTILDAAHAVVSRNRSRMAKRLWSSRDPGAPIGYYEAPNEQEEAYFIVQRIREAVRQGRREYGDYAVLYRTNAQSRAIEEVFINFSVPYTIVGSVRFYERKEVKDILAYLRCLQNPNDSVSLKRVINTPPRAIGTTSIGLLEEHARRGDGSLWDALQSVSDIGGLATRARRAMESFRDMIDRLRLLALEANLTDLVRAILAESGYMDFLASDSSQAGASRMENLQELLTVTVRFDASAEDRSLVAFLEQVALVSDLDDVETAQDTVTLMTLHSAKGLEFPVVFMTGMEEQVLPHVRSLDTDRGIEEERRLCYVGMTRARDELWLSLAYRRTLFGQVNNSVPSRFLRDVPRQLFHAPPSQARDRARPSVDPFPDDREDRRPWARGPELTGSREIQTRPAAPLAQPNRADAPFKPGDKVRHGTFGTGIVVAIQAVGADYQVSVAFPEVGIKKLMQSFANMVKA